MGLDLKQVSSKHDAPQSNPEVKVSGRLTVRRICTFLLPVAVIRISTKMTWLAVSVAVSRIWKIQ